MTLRGRRALPVITMAGALLAGAACGTDDPGAGAPPGPTATTPPATAPATTPPGTVASPARPKPAQLVTVYGAEGTFGVLEQGGDPRITAGSVGPRGPLTEAMPTAQPVAAFGFEPGASAAMAAVTDRGRVVIGTFPQTDNQVFSTMASMSVGVLDPIAATFSSLRIPTTAGREQADDTGDTGDPGASNGRGRGKGADVSDVCAADTVAGPRVLGVSMLPYKNWDPAFGTYPSVVALADGDAGVAIDAAGTRTAADLHNSPAGRTAIPSSNDDDPLAATTQGFNECDAAPNGDVIITQYLPAGRSSGGVVALGPEGTVVASFAGDPLVLPTDLTVDDETGRALRLPAGTTVVVSPREVKVDPSHTDPRDLRMVVISDVAINRKDVGLGSEDSIIPLPNVFQELSYDAVDHRMTARTPLLALRDPDPQGAANDIVRGETATYAPDGTLFMAQTHAGTYTAMPMAVFAPDSLAGRPTEPGALAPYVTPDTTIDAFDVHGLPGAPDSPVATSAFSLTYDADRHLLLSVGINGVLRAVPWTPGARGSGPGGAASPGCQVDLGGDVLRDANAPFRYQSRAGAIDAPRGVYYVPFQSVRPSSGAVPDRTPAPQFVFGIDLDRLAAQCGA